MMLPLRSTQKVIHGDLNGFIVTSEFAYVNIDKLVRSLDDVHTRADTVQSAECGEPKRTQ